MNRVEPALDYRAFLERKDQLDSAGGFRPLWLPDFLFDFQASLADWAIRLGRGAVFADCGLGKTPIELVWGENVVRLAGQAIRGVALGVVLTALIQALLGGIGLAIAGVPFATVLTAVMFMLAVAQIGADDSVPWRRSSLPVRSRGPLRRRPRARGRGNGRSTSAAAPVSAAPRAAAAPRASFRSEPRF